MEDAQGIEKLLFDLASESRLGIIRELDKQSLRMSELTRNLDLTATEAARQLQRLTDALLVQKLPDGTYTITNYARLTLQLLQPLVFAYMHKEYIESHDIGRLPHQFISRLGELSKGSLSLDTIENINQSGRIMNDAERYVWLMAERPMEPHVSIITEQATRGIEFKIIYSDVPPPNNAPVPAEAPRMETRGLGEIPVLILCTDKEAGICLRSIDGRMDYAGIHGKDQMFVSWARDFFLYCWDEAKVSHPTKAQLSSGAHRQ